MAQMSALPDMDSGTSDPTERLFDQLFMALTDGESPRLWSFVVTIFGDLAQNRDARISGALMGALVARIGARPETLRVALHRLRKEGWVESHKQGRSSTHALTPWGREQAAKASEVIYANAAIPSGNAPSAWLVMANPAERNRLNTAAATADDPADAASISAKEEKRHLLGPSTWISLRQPTPSKGLFAVPLDPETPVPEWVATRLFDASLVKTCRDLDRRLERISAHRSLLPNLSPLDRMVVRVLVVHSWRRVILKAPHLPAFLHPPLWRGQACADTVSAVLKAVPLVELPALERLVSERSWPAEGG